jgi:predicted short-subunit dehydrogenase-like oxidoreductase (DUF2520 family)
MDVGVVGAGRVGTALAALLAKAGYRIVAASGGQASRERAERFLPDVPFVTPAEAAVAADLVLLGVPDDRIAGVCAELAEGGALREGRSVVHLSGSVPLDALAPARASGALVLSLHPLQSFPTVEAAVDRMPGSAIAVTADSEEGYASGERLAADVGGIPFRLDDRNKPLYHAAAVFCSNYLAVLMGISERLFALAGIDDPVSKFAPLARATLENTLALGSEAALTGPAVRGDAGTIRRNLEALSADAPEVVPAYVELARSALDLAQGSGRLPEDRRSAVEEVLAGWS